MTTLRRERIQKFRKIITESKIYKQCNLSFNALEDELSMLVSSLADASVSNTERENDNPYYQIPKNTHYNSGEQERPDKISVMLAMTEFPGAKQQARIDALLSAFGVAFQKNVETKEWRSFAKYCISELTTKGWKPEVFIEWVKKQKGYPEFWSLKRMREDYPKAFAEFEKRNSVELHDDSNGIPLSY